MIRAAISSRKTLRARSVRESWSGTLAVPCSRCPGHEEEHYGPGAPPSSQNDHFRSGLDHMRPLGPSCPVNVLVTELSAIKLIADVEATLIGRGGIDGAEGGCLFQACGSEAEVAKLEAVLEKCYGRQTSGEEKSMVECSFPCAQCGRHLSCCYKAKGAKRC